MILSSKRLILREFIKEDWKAVFDYQTDPQYLEFYEWETRSKTEVQEFVQMFLEQQKQVPRIKFQLAIVLKSEEKVIGNCGIRKITPELPEASLGYEIASNYWGKGYATEAASTIIKFGFEELKLQRIYGWCIAENLASARVMEKVGMQFEERFTENEWFKGRWWDSLIFGISRDEWERTA
ncbi:GNAT family N-acetyltransferase [Scytonema sp. UIC 10036]|uniref:GNAT family N-acetyltransferase n=1 Tax=Scytonema sp. UIC 10036 TaxID=2304196 RepID=UPI0012DA327B|nr:GNAT family protein [Scytonema sp. UIC 10036]MUG97742.1 GNAT family N-acetyltransferase [Scytonema sp. UIC 10036]